MGLDTIKLERWRSHGKFTKLGNVHENEQKMNKVDKIRKEGSLVSIRAQLKDQNLSC